MSNYQHFIFDFPKRVNCILSRFYSEAESNDLEVTLLLTIAMSGFIVPVERLKGSHSSNDATTHSKTKMSYDELNKLPFVDSLLFDKDNFSSWTYIKKMSSVEGDVDSWSELNENTNNRIDSKIKTKNVLRHLRNALAHGNIFTKADNGKIKQLIFLSRIDNNKFKVEGTIQNNYDAFGYSSSTLELKRTNSQKDEFSLLAVSPKDFCAFLKKWFEFIKEPDASQEVMVSQI